MRKMLLVVCVVTLASAAMAQKIDTKWSCSKPSENPMLEVGDVPGHSYALGKGTCAATSSGSGEKSGAYTEFQEIRKTEFKNHGYFNVTMDNGDMVYYTYEGTGSTDVKKPLANKWKIVSGTGKHKGITGSGSCTGTPKEDGSADFVCSGTATMAGKAKAAPKS